jgi:Domain of unknown function (DUF4328)
MPNIAGRHQPKFGPPDPELPPLVAPRLVGKGERACPRCEAGVRLNDNFCRSCGLDLSRMAPPLPEGRVVGVWTSPGPHGSEWYRSLGFMSFVVRSVLWVAALAAVAAAGLGLVINRNLGGAMPWPKSAGGSVDWAELQAWSGILAACQLALLALASVLLIGWTRRAYRNLPALDVSGLLLHRRWAVLGWLIPVVNLFVPKRILDDTWRASDPEARPWSDGWQRVSVPVANQLWLVLGVVALPVVVLIQLQLGVFGTLPPTGSSTNSTQTLYLVLAVAQVLLVLSAALIARVVGTIDERQHERALVLGPAVPFPSRVEAHAEPAAAVEPSTPADPLLVRAANSGPAGLY